MYERTIGANCRECGKDFEHTGRASRELCDTCREKISKARQRARQQAYRDRKNADRPEPTCGDCGKSLLHLPGRGTRVTRCSDCKKIVKASENKAWRERKKSESTPCLVEDCPRPQHTKDWCKNHYERWRRYGEVRKDIPLPEQYPTTCNVDGCERTDGIRKGLCGNHYMRTLRVGEAGAAEMRYYGGPNEPGAVCTVDGCEKSMEVRSWCKLHYSRWQKRGRIDAHVPPRGNRSDGTCYIKSCPRPSPSGEWCNAHYYGWLEGNGLPPRFHNRVEICVIDGCNRKEQAFGWCSMHTSRWLTHASTIPHIPPQRWGGTGLPCSIDGCDKPTLGRRLCSKHYQQYRKHGQIGLRAAPGVDEIARRAVDMRERDRIHHSIRYALDPERYRATSRAYRAANPYKVKLWDQKKRAARRRARRVPFTAEQLAAKIAYWGDRCWMCGGPNETIDHVKPLAKDGWEMLANLRPACRSCNSRKQAKWPFAGMKYGFLLAA